jgi:rod shape-determining protein MreD
MELLFNHPARLITSLFPALIAAGLVVVANLPISFTGGLLPPPVLALAAVYYWTLVRPDLMPPFIVLLVGLLEDLLSGGPPGLWAAGFVAAYALADRQRETFAGLTGAGALMSFAAVMLLAGTIAYAVASAVYLRLAPLPPLLVESISTVLFYPLVAKSMRWVHQRVVGPMRSGH